MGTMETHSAPINPCWAIISSPETPVPQPRFRSSAAMASRAPVIEHLTIQGNKENNPYLNGCRGCGDLPVPQPRNENRPAARLKTYNGDGISFQQSNDVSVEDCICNGNTHLGLHPGSGSGSPTIRKCRSIRERPHRPFPLLAGQEWAF